MSTDYNQCIKCGEMFTNDNHGESIACEECGKLWCDSECAIDDGVIFKNDDYEEIKHCPYCNGDKVHYEDYEKLDFALKLLGITEEELINKMKNNLKREI